jgi:hypothetical protein
MATMKLTKTELNKAHQRWESAKKAISRVRERAEEATQRVVDTVEIGGAAFAMGVIQGKTGGVEIMGVPLELGGGLVLELLAFTGMAGKATDHLANFGNGMLAAYATTVGRGVGQSWEQTGKLGGGTSPKAISKGSDLTPEEIMAAQMAASS